MFVVHLFVIKGGLLLASSIVYLGYAFHKYFKNIYEKNKADTCSEVMQRAEMVLSQKFPNFISPSNRLSV